ncbi:MAG: flagellin lysine-N-methylase, partial [Thiohalomonadales bacterium]
MNLKYRLTILDNFSCLAAECPDDCCHGWNLHLDAETLGKWQQIENKSIRVELQNSISIITENGRAAEVVKQQSDGRCVFLSEQALCTIQQRCGHDYLPETCREYPRVSISSNETQLYSAHLSCPGIIQLLA